uniref:Uncharacterized protein n=1 Tax=Mycena chlorophos TaxID=658473 RepID=A0ABQ0M4X5_MYCCL|nr:predicted protein [Mycena chlorophos]
MAKGDGEGQCRREWERRGRREEYRDAPVEKRRLRRDASAAEDVVEMSAIVVLFSRAGASRAEAAFRVARDTEYHLQDDVKAFLGRRNGMLGAEKGGAGSSAKDNDKGWGYLPTSSGCGAAAVILGTRTSSPIALLGCRTHLRPTMFSSAT